MKSVEELRKKMDSARDLQSVVKAMKTLAAVNIRQYEKAAASLADYNRTIEMGLHILMKQRPPEISLPKPHLPKHLGGVIFGSDQGMCGQFNDQIAAFAIKQMDQMDIPAGNRLILPIGDRIVPAIQGTGQRIDPHIPFPGSVSGISETLMEILVRIEQWRSHQAIDQIVLFYHLPVSGTTSRPHLVQLLPLSLRWLHDLGQKDWPSRCLPTMAMDWHTLFSALIRQFFFVSLYRAFVASLASENASRLSSMQAAEKNIRENLEDLRAQYNHQRQSAITSELLDIVSGFETLS